jgi:homoserine O-acetyltransferase/O-succinyltransferase
MKTFKAINVLAFVLPSIMAAAADYPAPRQGEWIARDFKFHTGEVMPELKLHYTTVGEPTGAPLVALHGTGGSAAGMLTPAFAGELFGPGQPLDATKYYVSSPTHWVTAGARSPPMGSRRNSHSMIMQTWSMRNIGCYPKASASIMGGSLSATRWAG